jgi:hypothetical protein
MTDDDIMKHFDEFMKQAQEIEDKIPEDKDCKKCPYSENGQSLGMVTPCFDYCAGFGLGGLSIEEYDEMWDADDKWVEEMQEKGLSGPEIADLYKKRCEERREND